MHVSTALMQPIASYDVADAVTAYALGEPQDGIVEIAGPDRVSLSALVRQFLSLTNDSHEVVTDISAPYFGAVLQEKTLLPSSSARLAPTDFKTWFDRSEYAQAA